MSSASSSKKHCGKEHEEAPKNEQNRFQTTEKTEDNSNEELLEVEVDTVSKVVMILSASSNLNKKVKLTIDREQHQFYWFNKPPPRQDISNLKSIVVKYFNDGFRDFFDSHNFPDVEELRIECNMEPEEYEEDYHCLYQNMDFPRDIIYRNLNSIFYAVKNLKKLFIRISDTKAFYVTAYFENLESADAEYIFEYIQSSRGTLKQFKISLSIYFDQLVDLYSKYPKLEELTVSWHISHNSIREINEELPKNESIKHLDIDVVIYVCQSYLPATREKVNESTELEYLELVLASSPSLETLTMYMTISTAFVRFLARTMPKLKKVIGRGGAETDALDVLEKLKRTRKNSCLNTEFEICLEEIRSWDWEERLRLRAIRKSQDWNRYYYYEEHEEEEALKSKQNRIKTSENTDGKAKDELAVEVDTASKALKFLSGSSYLNKKVNLTIDCERKFRGKNKPPRQDISNLYSIVVKFFDESFRNFFISHNFPDVEELRIEYNLKPEDTYYNFDIVKTIIQSNLNAIFSGMKNLKKLFVRMGEANLSDVTAILNLESADVEFIFWFIESSKDTLKQLKIFSCFYFTQLVDLYENYPKLEELTGMLHIYRKCEEDLKIVLPKNLSIKHLDLHIEISTSFNNANAEIIIERTSSDYLELILVSSPSLETLTIYMPISGAFVRFLARTMPKLKKVFGRGGAIVDALDVLKKLKETSDDNFINTEFEICLEEIRSRDWHEKLRNEEIMKNYTWNDHRYSIIHR